MARKQPRATVTTTKRSTYRTPAEVTRAALLRELRVERQIVRLVDQLQRAIVRSDNSLQSLAQLIDLQIIGRRNRIPGTPRSEERNHA